MAQIIREDINPLNAKIKVSLEPDDYKEEYESEVKKIQQTAQIKGFRKGKMPKSSVEKLYGKGVLEEIVMRKMTEHLTSYLQNIPELIGEPVMSKDQPKIDFNNKDFFFHFDIGLAPKLGEIKGLDDDYVYVSYEIVEDTQKTIDELIDSVAKRAAKLEDVTDNIVEDDIIHFHAEELEGDELKEGGIKTEFIVQFKKDELYDNFVTLMESKKTGDIIRLNLYEIELSFTENDVREYYIQTKDNQPFSPYFEATIKRVSRYQKPEITVDLLRFFYDNEQLESIEQFREVVAESIMVQNQEMSFNILASDVKKKILEENKFELPTEFLLRAFELKQPDNQKSDVAGFDDYLQTIRKNVIVEQLANKFNISISEVEFENYLANVFRSYFPYAKKEDFANWLDSFAKNEQYTSVFYNQYLELKAFSQAASVVKTTTKQLSKEEANKILESYRHKRPEDDKSLIEMEEEVVSSENTLLQDNLDFENSTDVE